MSYYDLGAFKRTITTKSPEAQIWADRGLNWTYAYNHEEAVACFKKALDHDGACAFAHWGAAYDATPVEQALIRALPARYPQRDPIEDQSAWNDYYADAMRRVYEAHPDDLEVRTIFVEAIMNRTPWKMWDLETGGVAEGAGTAEAQEVLESVFRDLPAAWEHPGILHLYVHLMEMSPFPQKALRAGDCLRDLVPDAGHLIHMLTHIDVLCGQYRDVVVYNERAIAADQKFLEKVRSDELLCVVSHTQSPLRDLWHHVPWPVHAGDQGGPATHRQYTRGSCTHSVTADGRFHRGLHPHEAARPGALRQMA